VLLQGFFHVILPVGVVFVSTDIGDVSTDIGDVSAGFGHTRATGSFRVWCTPGGVAAHRALEPGPIRGDRGELFFLF
jgi:hypothetical protein